MFGSVFCETVCGYCVLGTAPERDQTTRETPRQTVELYIEAPVVVAGISNFPSTEPICNKHDSCHELYRGHDRPRPVAL